MTLAIVTGGNRGIGLAIARKLAENGIDIVIAARNRRLMADAKSCIEKLGVKCWAFSCDVTSKKEIANLVKEVSKLGPVDILVNNAGIGFLKNFNYNKNNEIDSMIDTNFRGLVYFTKAFLPVMLARKKGIIINIASICGKIGYRELAVYCGTKFAVIGFTESLANEVVHDNVRVFAFCPAGTETDMWCGMHPGKQAEYKPEEVAVGVWELIKNAERIKPGRAIDVRKKSRFAGLLSQMKLKG